MMDDEASSDQDRQVTTAPPPQAKVQFMRTSSSSSSPPSNKNAKIPPHSPHAVVVGDADPEKENPMPLAFASKQSANDSGTMSRSPPAIASQTATPVDSILHVEVGFPPIRTAQDGHGDHKKNQHAFMLLPDGCKTEGNDTQGGLIVDPTQNVQSPQLPSYIASSTSPAAGNKTPLTVITDEAETNDNIDDGKEAGTPKPPPPPPPPPVRTDESASSSASASLLLIQDISGENNNNGGALTSSSPHRQHSTAAMLSPKSLRMMMVSGLPALPQRSLMQQASGGVRTSTNSTTASSVCGSPIGGACLTPVEQSVSDKFSSPPVFMNTSTSPSGKSPNSDEHLDGKSNSTGSSNGIGGATGHTTKFHNNGGLISMVVVSDDESATPKGGQHTLPPLSSGVHVRPASEETSVRARARRPTATNSEDHPLSFEASSTDVDVEGQTSGGSQQQGRSAVAYYFGRSSSGTGGHRGSLGGSWMSSAGASFADPDLKFFLESALSSRTSIGGLGAVDGSGHNGSSSASLTPNAKHTSLHSSGTDYSTGGIASSPLVGQVQGLPSPESPNRLPYQRNDPNDLSVPADAEPLEEGEFSLSRCAFGAADHSWHRWDTFRNHNSIKTVPHSLDTSATAFAVDDLQLREQFHLLKCVEATIIATQDGDMNFGFFDGKKDETNPLRRESKDTAPDLEPVRVDTTSASESCDTSSYTPTPKSVGGETVAGRPDQRRSVTLSTGGSQNTSDMRTRSSSEVHTTSTSAANNMRHEGDLYSPSNYTLFDVHPPSSSSAHGVGGDFSNGSNATLLSVEGISDGGGAATVTTPPAAIPPPPHGSGSSTSTLPYQRSTTTNMASFSALPTSAQGSNSTVEDCGDATHNGAQATGIITSVREASTRSLHSELSNSYPSTNQHTVSADNNEVSSSTSALTTVATTNAPTPHNNDSVVDGSALPRDAAAGRTPHRFSDEEEGMSPRPPQVPRPPKSNNNNNSQLCSDDWQAVHLLPQQPAPLTSAKTTSNTFYALSVLEAVVATPSIPHVCPSQGTHLAHAPTPANHLQLVGYDAKHRRVAAVNNNIADHHHHDTCLGSSRCTVDDEDREELERLHLLFESYTMSSTGESGKNSVPVESV